MTKAIRTNDYLTDPIVTQKCNYFTSLLLQFIHSTRHFIIVQANRLGYSVNIIWFPSFLFGKFVICWKVFSIYFSFFLCRVLYFSFVWKSNFPHFIHLCWLGMNEKKLQSNNNENITQSTQQLYFRLTNSKNKC